MCGLTVNAPNVGLLDFCDPSVHVKPSKFHAEWNCMIESLLGFCVGLGMSG